MTSETHPITRPTPSLVALLLLSLLFTALAGCGTTRQHHSQPLADTIELHDLGYNEAWASSVQVPRGHDLTHAVLLGDQLITVEMPSRLVTAVSLRDGSLQWRTVVADPSDSLHEPFAYRDRIVINSGHEIFQLDKETGNLLHVGELRMPVNTRPGLYGSLAIFGAMNGRVFAHDLDSTFTTWQYQLNDAVKAPPLVVNNRVFVADASPPANCGGDVAPSTGLWRNRFIIGAPS